MLGAALGLARALEIIGEGRVGADVTTPPQLQDLVGRRVTRRELEDLGARAEGDDLVISYGGQDWLLSLSPDA